MKNDLFIAKPVFNEHYNIRGVADDRYLLINSTTGDVFEVNETANLIISDIKEHKQVSDIWKHITQESNDNEFSEKDLIEFINVLLENEIISL